MWVPLMFGEMTMPAPAAVLWLVLGLHTAAVVLLGLLVVAAFLESALGLCLGCKAFALLMRGGVIPADVCERCAPSEPRGTERQQRGKPGRQG